MEGDTRVLIRWEWILRDTPSILPLVLPPPQSSSLCLWGISLVFCVTESVFAVRCAQLAHQLLELRPWWGKSSHHMVRPATYSISPDSPYLWEPLLGSPGWSAPTPCLEKWGKSFFPQEQLGHNAETWLPPTKGQDES